MTSGNAATLLGIAIVSVLTAGPASASFPSGPTAPPLDQAKLQRVARLDFEEALRELRTLPPEAFVRHALALSTLWSQRGNRGVARQYIEAALGEARAAALHGVEGRVHCVYAGFLLDAGDRTAALDHARSATRLLEVAGTPEEVKAALALQGHIEHLAGFLPACAQTYEKLLNLVTGPDEALLKAHCLEELALVRYKTGRTQDVQAMAEQAMAIYAGKGNEKGVADCLKVLGNAASAEGRQKDALSYYERAAEAYEAANEPHGQANCLFNLGILHREMGDHAASISSLQDAIAFYTRSSSMTGVGIANMEMGRTHLLQKELAKAEAALLLAERLLTTSQDFCRLAQTQEALAELRIAQGDSAAAAKHYRQAAAFFERIGMSNDLRRVRKALEALASPPPGPAPKQRK